MADEFNALVKRFSPQLQKLARTVRRFVLEEMPSAVEQVKPGWHAIWYGTTPKMGDIVVVIHLQDRSVNLEFARGATLPDPARLLEGTGENMRHVKIRDEAVLEKPEFLALMRAAIAAGPPKRA
jgi:hypothetical protein